MKVIEQETIVVESAGATFGVGPARPSGPAAAALLSAGIGSLVLGVMTTGAQVSAPLRTLLTLDAGVGPLSGKTTAAVLAYLVSWALLAVYYRRRDVPLRPIFAATFAMVALGVLLTFPLFFEAFG